MELKGKTSDQIIEAFCKKHNIELFEYAEFNKIIKKTEVKTIFKEILAIIGIIILYSFEFCILIAATSKSYKFPYLFENLNHDIFLLFGNIVYIILIILIPIILFVFLVKYLIK